MYVAACGRVLRRLIKGGRNVKILFLANAASIHTVRWVNALSDRNHEVHLVYKYDDKPIDNKINDKVILHQLKYSGTKGYFLNVIRMKRLLRKIKPDIVNAHYASGYGTLARLSKLNPLILSVWGSDVYDFPYQSTFKMKLVTKNLLYADAIASTSHCMAEQVEKLLPSYNREIQVTPFGVDVNKFCSENNYNDSLNSIKIGTIKTLAPKYGIDDLIKSIRLLIDNLVEKGLEEIASKIKVHIYGDGKQKIELEELIHNLNLNDIVHLKGRIPNDEVPNALKELDIFCLTSVFESFGVSAVEAMAMKVPIVATDVDGFKEVIKTEETGFIVERNDLKTLAEKIEKLVLDKELRKYMGAQGRKRVLELYNWENNVNTMVELYKKIIKKNSRD